MRLSGMETVFPKLECEPPVGAAPVFPDTVLRRALGLPLQRVRFGWGLQGMFGLSSEENVGEQMPCHPPHPPEGNRRTWLWANPPAKHIGDG